MAATLLNRSDIHPDRPRRTAVAPRRSAGGDRDEQVRFGGEDRALTGLRRRVAIAALPALDINTRSS